MITDKVVIDSINKTLHENYRVLDGRPIYRLVWSDNQLEKRFSDKWCDYYGHILIRSEYKAVRTIKKYWHITQAHNGSYEPVYTFRDAKNNPLPVVFEVVDFILQGLHAPRRRTASDMDKIREIEEAEEVKYFENELHEGERSPLFVWDNSAFVSTNQLRFRQDYIEKSKLVEIPDACI